jgi:hypothetical protein
VLDQRGQLLRAALGFAGCSMPPTTPRSTPCARGSTPGPASAASQSGWRARGYDLQLTRYDEKGWRATFYTTGMEHSPTSATGTGWERTPWQATQRAAWEALGRIESMKQSGLL